MGGQIPIEKHYRSFLYYLFDSLKFECFIAGHYLGSAIIVAPLV